MGSRIDLVTVRLYLYDEQDGHKEVTFTVMPQEPFLSAVWLEWRRWSAERDLRAAGGGADGCFG